MRWLVGAVLVALLLTAFDPADAVGRSMTSCGVKAIYQGVALPTGSLVVTAYDQVEDATVVYTPLRLSAGTYSVSVTRKGPDLYAVAGQNVVIGTQFCFEYAYGERAVLEFNGYGGQLDFSP